MIDAGIYSQVRQPEVFNPLAEAAQFQQLQGLQNQNKLAALGFQDRERAINDAATQREAVRGFGADTGANYNRLLQTGNLQAAQGYQKGILENQRYAAETTQKGVETGSKAFDQFKAMLNTVQDPQQAAQLITASFNDPTIGPLLQRFGTLEEGLQRLQQQASNPQAFQQWKAQAAIGMEKLAELAKVQNVNLGGTMQTQSVQPATGQVAQLATAPITQSADNRATQQTAIRGQNMTDSRAREMNQTQRELLIQERGLKVADLQDKADARARAKDAGAASIQNQIAVIDKALAHPGRKTATGLSGSVDPRNYVPGTDATDFRAVLDQIGGAAFLQAFESLKGGGAITEVEGKKATDAIARLNRAQSDSEFESSLRDLRKVMSDGYERLGRGKAPDPAALGGVRRYNPSTGQIE